MEQIDLAPYCIGPKWGPEKGLFAVGFLGPKNGLPTGDPPPWLASKLADIFYASRPAYLLADGTLSGVASGINYGWEKYRGIPSPCPFCEPKATPEDEFHSITDADSNVYSGPLRITLGITEYVAPKVDADEAFVYPDEIIHYIREHSYSPPQEFVEAIDLIDLSKPYNTEAW